MHHKQVLSELKSLGTAQNRKVYARHGVQSAMYGVSYANLGKLKKKIKVDHGLALKLWGSRNHDARILATMIADPAQTREADLDAWAKEMDNYVITDAFSGLASRTPHMHSKMKKWTRSKQEWIASAGWNLVTQAALRDAGLPNAYFEECLETIEQNIHKSKNRVRYAMNGALIAIGMRNAQLEKKAVAAAKRVGTVEVDHGETGCKTPDAVTYIQKAKGRRKKR
jgi:3-methyladenine DNA glycosylase AlkD